MYPEVCLCLYGTAGRHVRRRRSCFITPLTWREVAVGFTYFSDALIVSL